MNLAHPLLLPAVFGIIGAAILISIFTHFA